MKSKFNNGSYISDSFGGQLRDNILKFQLDHKVARALSVRVEDTIAYFTLTAADGEILSEESFKFKSSRGELVSVTLIPDVDPETGEPQTPQLKFSFENEDLYCDLTSLYDMIHALDDKFEQKIADEIATRSEADEAIHDRLDNIEFSSELPVELTPEVLRLVRDGEHYYKLHDKRVKVIEKSISNYINDNEYLWTDEEKAIVSLTDDSIVILLLKVLDNGKIYTFVRENISPNLLNEGDFSIDFYSDLQLKYFEAGNNVCSGYYRWLDANAAGFSTKESFLRLPIDIVSALARKQDVLTFDDAPTDNSDNPVKSKGIKSALDNKVDKVAGKGLSENDFTNAYKDNVDLNTSNRHSHQNKEILDSTTASFTAEIANNIDSHIANKNNPHEVTKAQVGLGNVDNTSDSAKPVSAAQQAALDLKQDKLVSGENIKLLGNESLLGSDRIVDLNGIEHINLSPKGGGTMDNPQLYIGNGYRDYAHTKIIDGAICVEGGSLSAEAHSTKINTSNINYSYICTYDHTRDFEAVLELPHESGTLGLDSEVIFEGAKRGQGDAESLNIADLEKFRLVAFSGYKEGISAPNKTTIVFDPQLIKPVNDETQTGIFASSARNGEGS
jgi:hypothetical protein